LELPKKTKNLDFEKYVRTHEHRFLLIKEFSGFDGLGSGSLVSIYSARKWQNPRLVIYSCFAPTPEISFLEHIMNNKHIKLSITEGQSWGFERDWTPFNTGMSFE
jgi:hypothetical protein